MKPSLRSLTLSISGLLAFFPTLSFSQNSPLTPELNQAFPLTPRATGLGMAGDDTVAWGDVMVPLAGNASQIWYMDMQAKTAFDSDWFGGMGTGLRKVFNDQGIWGVYVFVDRTVSPESNTFWFVNPGIEELGNWVDFRANGYLPTSSKKQCGRTDWADNFGVYDYVSFAGHTQYDILMTQDEEVGWGGDAEIGIKLPFFNTRAYVGGYHFNFADASDINGVAGRIEIPVNRYLGFTLRDSYDNEQHNTILAGIKITIGGVNLHPRAPHQAIQERILDPIERNMATLGQGVGEPVQNVLTPVINNSPNPPPPLVERDNIWYFSPNGTDTFTGSLEDCTYENVCISSDFTQATIDGINAIEITSPEIYMAPNPSFYLAPGEYSSLDGEGNPLSLTNDSIWGRSEDFIKPQRSAILSGALVINGNDNLLDNILLQSDGSQDLGIQLLAGSYLKIQNSQIGSTEPTLRYHTAIELNDAGLVVLGIEDGTLDNRSEIIAYGSDGLPVVGIKATYTTANLLPLTISNSDVLATSIVFEPQGSDSATQTGFNQSATALSLEGAPAVVIANSTVQATASLDGDQTAGSSTMATGIYTNNSKIDILDSAVRAEATVNGSNAGNNLASAIGANSVDENLTLQSNEIDISGSFIAATAQIDGDNLGGVNAAVGIGVNAINTIGEDLFTDNTFKIHDFSTINTTARIMGDNQAINDGDTQRNANNMAAGIGTNGVDADNAKTVGNVFTINNITLNSSAMVNQSNLIPEDLQDLNYEASPLPLNMSTGMGGNGSSAFTERESVTNTSFIGNQINIQNSETFTASASIGENNQGINIAAGLGGNSVYSSSNFEDNDYIHLTNSRVNGFASVGEDEEWLSIRAASYASGLGGNAYLADATFEDNGDIILDHSEVHGEVVIGGDSVIAMATGFGGNAVNTPGDTSTSNVGFINNGNIKLMNASQANAVVFVMGNNNYFALATGFGGNGLDGNVGASYTGNDGINIIGDSSVNTNITIGAPMGNSVAVLSMGFGGAAFFNDNGSINITDSSISATANIFGDSSLLLLVRGVGISGNSNDSITITDSDVVTQAAAQGTVSGTIESTDLNSDSSGTLTMIGGSLSASLQGGQGNCTSGGGGIDITGVPIMDRNCS